ncbi:hypothetical protein Bbelb_073220 [Branchiostoma belcheri]|nr:hypothetical protein Bbelb_073220 [Branchiostoma belcheri]
MKTVTVSAILFLLSGFHIEQTVTQTVTPTPCPEPGTVKITGDYLRIVGTAEEPVLFEATLDPPYSCYQEVTYSWHCRQNVTNSLVSSTPAPIGQYSPSSRDSSGNNVYTNACSDVNFQELSGAGSAIRLNQSTMDPGAIYVIKVNVTVGTASVSFAQELHVIGGGPLPVFEIRCRDNCLNILKVTKEFKAEVHCSAVCGRDDWDYRWQLFEENVETGDVAEIPNLAVLLDEDIDDDSLKVDDNILEPGKKYRFRVTGTAEEDGSIWSFTEYHVLSTPIYNVNCSVIPKTGFAADAGFTIAAEVPVEVSSEEDIDYSFFSSNTLLTTQRESAAGPYRLESGVIDSHFAVTIKVQAVGDKGFFSECYVNASGQPNSPGLDSPVAVLPPPKPPLNLWQDTLTLAYEAEVEIDQGDAATAASLAVNIVDLLDQVLAGDPDPSQTLTDQGYGDLLNEALNSTTHHPSPTAPPVRNGYIFGHDWSTATTIDGVSNMLPPNTPGTGENKGTRPVACQDSNPGPLGSESSTRAVTPHDLTLSVFSLQMFVRSTLIEKLSGRAAELRDVSSLQQGTDGMVKLLNTGGQVYIESQVLAAESLLHYSTNLHQATLAGGDQIDGEQLPTVLGHFDDATDVLTSVVLRSSLSDSPPVVFDTPVGSVMYQKHTKENIQQGGFATERDEGFVTLPDPSAVFGTENNENIIDSKFVAFTRNPMTWDPETIPRSSVLSLDFFNETGTRLPVQDTPSPLKFHIQNYDKPGFPNVTFMNESTVADNGLTYHRMDVDNDTTPTPVLVMLIPPPHVVGREQVFLWESAERACDVSGPELSGRDVTDLFPWLYPEVNGTYYIGVKELGPNECRNVPGASVADVKSKIKDALDNETYSLAILTPQCVWWDKNGVGQWKPSGCTVGPDTTARYTQCLTTHLTAFGSDFIVPPNSIDFSTVFAKFANLSDNAAVFSTVIVMFGIYFIIVYFLFKADKLDRLKWGVLPIADNKESDENFYLLTVYTGLKSGSGTSSKAGIILHGADGDTRPRPLAASKNQVFKRGSISSFLLSTSVDLGDLTHLHVWHDNSGTGGDASWFLDKIVVGDLRSDKRYVFFCQRWLAVEMEDGKVDRFLSAAGRDELTNFSSIFHERTRTDMSDGHLWFSVASRPTRSHFTRVQRASCCLSLVFLTMITNAMFYQTDDSGRQQAFVLMRSDHEREIHVARLEVYAGGFVGFPMMNGMSTGMSLTHIYAHIPGNPWEDPEDQSATDGPTFCDPEALNFIIVYVFSKSRPNPGKTRQSSTGSLYTTPSSSFELTKMHRDPLKRQNKERKQSGLPHWCVYIGWVLVFLSATGSAFFVILYSMEWGAEKSGEWLTSILLSIFQSVLLVQPLKVLLLGLLIAFIFKKTGKSEIVDAGALNDDEEFLPRSMDAKDVRPPEQPVSSRAADDMQLAAARALRLKEARMRTILWDVFKHFLVVTVVFYLAFSSAATVGYHMNKSLNGRFPNFTKINSIDKLWSWSNTELLGVLFTQNGSKLLDDQSYRVGAAAFKQFRSRPGDCRTNITPFPTCKLDYTMEQHEERDFAVAWRSLPETDVNGTRCRPNCANDTAWTFTKGKSLPYFGQVRTYTDGAYMFEIGDDPEQAVFTMEHLQENGWLDGFTEAVVVEINAYNANADLFAVITLIVEFVAGRGTTASRNVHVFKLSSYVGTSGHLMIGFQITFVVLFALSLFREGKKMFQQKRVYFCQPWNCLEFFRLVICVVAVVLFAVKEGLRSSYVSQLKAREGEFLSFRIIANFTDVFASILALLVFVMTLQFLQLLSFNRFIAFSTLGGLLFGGEAESYITILSSARTLLVMMFGDMSFTDMSAHHVIIGRIYFLSFVIAVVMVLSNMFLGILDEQFSTSKNNPDGPGGDSDMGEFMVNKVLQYFGIGTRAVRPEGSKKSLKEDQATEYTEELEDKLDLVLKKINLL